MTRYKSVIYRCRKCPLTIRYRVAVADAHLAGVEHRTLEPESCLRCVEVMAMAWKAEPVLAAHTGLTTDRMVEDIDPLTQQKRTIAEETR